MNAKKCVEALCQEYPGMTPYLYTAYDGKYYFSICETGTPKEERILDFHSVDPVSLKVSGNIPTMSLLTNSKFVEALKNAKPIVFQDEAHIEHHGIKGQKWGVMNGPPYPLNKKTHDRVVNGTQQIKKEGNLAAIAAIGVGLAVEALTYKAVESAVINAHHKRTKQQINSHDEHLEKVADTKHLYTKDSPPKQTTGKHSVADDLKKVNPLYDENVANTTNNCVLCTMTYDMRRRGYDVTSRLSAEPLQSLRFFKEVYQPPPKQDKYSNNRTFEDVEYSILKKNPEGSRGELGVGGYKNGMWFGHAMAFEVNNGKLTILDPQSNQKYSSFKDMKASNEGQSTILDIIKPEYTTTIRLDDKGVNIPALNSVCADYKDFIKHVDAGKAFLAHFGIKG